MIRGVFLSLCFAFFSTCCFVLVQFLSLKLSAASSFYDCCFDMGMETLSTPQVILAVWIYSPCAIPLGREAEERGPLPCSYALSHPHTSQQQFYERLCQSDTNTVDVMIPMILTTPLQLLWYQWLSMLRNELIDRATSNDYSELNILRWARVWS